MSLTLNLQNMLRSLSTTERVLIFWSDRNRYTTRQIAKALNMHNGTVCNIILRARDRGDVRAKQRRPSQGFYHREARFERGREAR